MSWVLQFKACIIKEHNVLHSLSHLRLLKSREMNSNILLNPKCQVGENDDELKELEGV